MLLSAFGHTIPFIVTQLRPNVPAGTLRSGAWRARLLCSPQRLTCRTLWCATCAAGFESDLPIAYAPPLLRRQSTQPATPSPAAHSMSGPTTRQEREEDRRRRNAEFAAAWERRKQAEHASAEERRLGALAPGVDAEAANRRVRLRLHTGQDVLVRAAGDTPLAALAQLAVERAPLDTVPFDLMRVVDRKVLSPEDSVDAAGAAGAVVEQRVRRAETVRPAGSAASPADTRR